MFVAAPSSFRIWQRRACYGPPAPNLGLHALYRPQRPINPPRRLHRKWLSEVRHASAFSVPSIPLIRLLYSYRSYRGYNYDPAYTSHAHGWSSGPTSALTYYVLGLQVTSPQGATWSFAPHTSGLSSAEGGFTTPLGWFGAKWTVLLQVGKLQVFTAKLSVPKGTKGTVKVPVLGVVSVNGKSVLALESTDGNAALNLEGGGEYDIVVQA